MIVYIKHIDIEGPATLGEFMNQKGMSSVTVNVLDGDPLLQDWDQIEAVVGLGGPMNVYEEEKYPALKAENAFLKEVIRREIPYLGLCLGSQLLAKAGEARVVASPVKEIGWYHIVLQQDPLFEGLDPNLEVFHWHGDMFELPLGATLIATAEGCPHQAFRLGKVAYGLQFHIEITDRSINEWSKAYAPHEQKHREAMLKRYADIESYYREQAHILYNNFYKMIKG